MRPEEYPAGYRFVPNDLELVSYYLARQISGLYFPPNPNILTVDIYNFSPVALFNKYKLSEEKEWYFFSSRTKKYPQSKRPIRAAGDGFWKATGGVSNINDKNGISVGCKRSLVYYKGTSKCNEKTTWSMVEYQINHNGPLKTSSKDMLLDKCVLCKIYHRKCSTKNPKSDQQELAIGNPPPSLCDKPNSLLPLPQSVPVHPTQMSENNQDRVYTDMTSDEKMQFSQVPPSVSKGEFIPQSDPQLSYNVQSNPIIDLDAITTDAVNRFLQKSTTGREERFVYPDPHLSHVIHIDTIHHIDNMEIDIDFLPSTLGSTETNNPWQNVDVLEDLLPFNYFDPFDVNPSVEGSQANGGFTVKTSFS